VAGLLASRPVLVTYDRYQAAASCVFFAPIFFVYYEALRARSPARCSRSPA